MQSPRRASTTELESPAPVRNRAKYLAAGVAIAATSALAITPSVVSPMASSDVQIQRIEQARADAYGLTAFQNPLEVWQDVFNGYEVVFTNPDGSPKVVQEGLSLQLQKLFEGSSEQWEQLAETFSDPDVQAQFVNSFRNLADPERYQTVAANIPDYVERIGNAGEGLFDQIQEAVEALPEVLQASAALLAAGDPFGAYSEINYWFLTAGLSDFRGSMLDAFRVPGDFFDDLGVEPLSRILGASWMDEAFDSQQRPGWASYGLLNRGMIGNFARAVLAPQVTTVFQTLEIVETFAGAVQGGDFETAASELVNAPAKITGAFLVGYIPKFVREQGSVGTGQNFPGIFTVNSTFDFFTRQVPEQINKTLTAERPDPEDTSNRNGDPGALPSNLALTVAAAPTQTGSEKKSQDLTPTADIQGTNVANPTNEGDEGDGTGLKDRAEAPANLASELANDAKADGEAPGTQAPKSSTRSASSSVGSKIQQRAEKLQNSITKRVDKLTNSITKRIGLGGKSNGSAADSSSPSGPSASSGNGGNGGGEGSGGGNGSGGSSD